MLQGLVVSRVRQIQQNLETKHRDEESRFAKHKSMSHRFSSVLFLPCHTEDMSAGDNIKYSILSACLLNLT